MTSTSIGREFGAETGKDLASTAVVYSLLAEMKRETIETENDLTSYAILSGGECEPKIYEVRTKDGRIILRLNTDAIDSMSFSEIAADCDPAEQKIALKLIVQAIQKRYGGKNFFAIPAHLVAAAKEFGLYDIPPSNEYYNRLMYISMEKLGQSLELLQAKKMTKEKDKQIEVKFVTDKDALTKDAKAWSHLYWGHADYANPDAKPENSRTYATEAMIRRFAPKKIFYVGAEDNTHQKLAGVRYYVEKEAVDEAPGTGIDKKIQGGYAYVGDLVTHKDKRRLGLAAEIFQHAYKQLKAKGVEYVIFVAGSEELLKMYQEMGGVSFVQSKKPVVFRNDTTFMAGIFPKQQDLQKFHRRFLSSDEAHFDKRQMTSISRSALPAASELSASSSPKVETSSSTALSL